MLHTMGTAYLGICREGGIGYCNTVFIGGAGGGVGSAAVQLAVERGARVLASASPNDFDWVRSCGAQEVFDYHDDALSGELRERRSAGFDLYWDCSGHQDLAETVAVMALGGRIIASAGISSSDRVPTGAMYTHDISIRGFAISNASLDDLGAAAEQINTMLRARRIKSRVGRNLPLADAAAAHRLLESGSLRGLRGRIVIHAAHV